MGRRRHPTTGSGDRRGLAATAIRAAYAAIALGLAGVADPVAALGTGEVPAPRVTI